MKVINFNMREVIGDLFAKRKVQTIRKAWNQEGDKIILDEESRYKVNDKVLIVWKRKRQVGRVMITAVEQIKISKENGEIRIDGSNISDEELAKKDGFKSKEDMYAWFKKYNKFYKPMPFWVYRWEWLEDKKKVKGLLSEVN